MTQIAVLEQQIAQMASEQKQSRMREAQSKAFYERILKAINDQFITNEDMNQNAFLVCLSNVQTLITEASKALYSSPDNQAEDHIKRLSDTLLKGRDS